MTGGGEAFGRAERDLAAARHLLGGGFHEQACSRAYLAAFHAAVAALAVLGEVRAKHAGVISAFGRLLVRERGLDPQAGRALRRLFEQRGDADYSFVPVPAEQAGAAIHDAETVLASVRAWRASEAEH